MREKGQAIAKQLLFFPGVFAKQGNFPRDFFAIAKKGLRQKGQSIAIDLFLGVAIFLLLLAAVLAIWSNSERSASTKLFEGEMERMAEKAFDALIRSPGHPANWEQPEAGDVIAIGLAKSDRVIDENKLLQFPTAGVNRGLVAYYKMDEYGGQTTADSSGNANNGTLQPTLPVWQLESECKSKSCLQFNSGYVSLGAGLALLGDFTISAWVKPSETTTHKGIYSRGVYTAQNKGVYFILSSTGNIRIYVGNGTVSQTYSPSIYYSANEWAHVVAVRKGSTLELYKNGIGSSGTGISGNISYNSNNPRIGQGYAGGYPFKGLIDELRIYSRALSAAEIKALYENPGGDLSSSTFLKQKLLIGDNSYFFRLWDPIDTVSEGIGGPIKNSKGEDMSIGIGIDPNDPNKLSEEIQKNLIKTKLSTAVVYKYKRIGEGEATQHEAIAEFILYRTRQ